MAKIVFSMLGVSLCIFGSWPLASKVIHQTFFGKGREYVTSFEDLIVYGLVGVIGALFLIIVKLEELVEVIRKSE